ncbi:MAG: hypothetical protein NTW03_07450, partial [Verrucomicrobia bacterium]|nr:hypothetical protein [Verrucomicrobiota bacterium]
QHGDQGPFDISKIIAADPSAMNHPTSPLWGPLHVPHHWGESWFDYYVSDDEGVLAKHAQMLADAGIDVVIFDVTNQLTYPRSWRALCRVWNRIRRHGGRTPQIAFLCPFGDPRKVVRELWQDLYEPGLYSDLWFCWEGKPLILADGSFLNYTHAGNEKWNVPARLEPGHTLGQSFVTDKPAEAVGGCFPTWSTTNAALTLTCYRQGAVREPVASQRFENVSDNGWLFLRFAPALPAGAYDLEMSAGQGRVGWWSHARDLLPRGQALADGVPTAGNRALRIVAADEQNVRVRRFFTFRKPQPDYFRGPTRPDMWGWLEVYPQHVFTNSRGEKEQMTVGVAQNAVTNRLGSMSEREARGRSFHQGAFDRSPGAVLRGYNVAEQWERALQEDPPFIFVTGWNEWIAGRFNEFGGVKLPVMFVDQFDQEHSRDIEPMKGGHGDNYYYQMISYIRRFKGARALPPTRTRPIRMDGHFEDWAGVEPEFRDDVGDPVQRDHPGWGKGSRYVNKTGRNDIVAAKASCDAANVYFYVRTREPLSPCADPNWMLLFINADGNPTNGWLGYDFVVNRTGLTPQRTTLEQQQGEGYHWGAPVEIEYRAVGHELELAIPRAALGLTSRPATLDFKWADNIPQTGEASDFTLYGDAAPNDRFNYRARLE